MEGARRIDEWSQIADRVPHLDVIPQLAPGDSDNPGRLDLLPQEWKVLAAIDGESTLRTIAVNLAMNEFDVARVVYGLVTTGVVVVRQWRRTSAVARDESPASVALAPRPGVPSALRQGAEAFRRGALTEGIASWNAFLAQSGHYPGAGAIRDGVAAAKRLLEVLDREVPRER
jgi:hypothetical protein